jgi:archaellum component FlaD/FlaE/outer membrane murein-binding lipoprotein Lpp
MIFGSEDEKDDSTEKSAESDDMSGSGDTHANDSGPEVSLGNTGDRELQEVETRLNDMEADPEQTSASVRSIEGKQEELSEDVKQLNDRIRQLLSMYDQAAADANPFTGESDGDGSDGFGVVGSPETHGDADEFGDDSDRFETSESPETGTTQDPGTHTSGERPPGAETNTQDTEQPESNADAGLTFEELKTQMTDEAQKQSEGHDAVEENRERQQSDRVAVEDAQPGRAGGHSWNSDLSQADVPDTGNATLETVPQTYAADIIVMDWMSMLIRRSGLAGALKSFEYYESVDWISSSVRQYLETTLSGPGIDTHIEPDSPHEPRSEDHRESYTYIEQLDKLTEVDGWGSA